MGILFVTSEAFPLIKTGGLADVSGSLPTALKALGRDIRILLPAYQTVLAQAHEAGARAVSRMGVGEAMVTVWETQLPGTDVPVYLVDHANSFDRPGNPYLDNNGHDWPDNAQRFLRFSRVATRIAQDQAGLDWQPTVVHCSDWQSGMVPALLSLEPHRPATVFTVHNLSYRGLFPYSTFESLELPPSFWRFDSLEFHGQLSFIKGGLVYADRITTVSPSYAREILTPAGGIGLDGLLRHRGDALRGILNGIDTDVWNPAKDPHIGTRYDAAKVARKVENKKALQRDCQLEPSEAPMVGFIGRLVEQKGIDLLLGALPRLLALGAQLVVLGSGDALFEEALLQTAAQHPGRISVTLGYDEALAHRIEAGSDLFLMPSRFEPCGLNQMYSQRYGTLPVVHAVGGLRDTVVDLTLDASNQAQATGFQFFEPTTPALTGALERACDLYRQAPEIWRQMQQNGMAKDFSWLNSARTYAALYDEIGKHSN